jgi:diguanylate cyclase (GGDEF)-like protein
MNHPTDTQILILAQHGKRGEAWLAALADEGCEVWQSRKAVPPDAVPEIVLTDRDLSEAGFSEHRWITDDGPAPVGVIRVGESDGGSAADVLLPPDCTPRELCLACRLLGEIIRLRRSNQLVARAHHQLRRRAMTDPLTGLPNRHAWDDAMVAILGQGVTNLCLAILDLDHFKHVNDSDGHAAGDRVLVATGQALQESLRESDFIARLGGDEFGLLLKMPDAETANSVLERVRTRLPGQFDDMTGRFLTASIGYHFGVAQKDTAETLYAAASTALRTAKREGRNQTCGYPMHETAER